MSYQTTARTLKFLDTLKPEARSVIVELLELGYKNALNPQIHSAYRSSTEQDNLYAMGRTKPGKIVTNSRGYQSNHQYRIAVDMHFDDNQDSVAEWDLPKYTKLWNLAVSAGLDKKGLRWAGNWEKFKESAHFEVSFGKTWREIAKENGVDVDKLFPLAAPAAPSIKQPLSQAPTASSTKKTKK